MSTAEAMDGEVATEKNERSCLSLVDPSGVLYLEKDRLVREITKEHSAFFEKVVGENLISDLYSELIIRADLSHERGTDGVDLVHPRLPFVSYPCEWTGQMLRDAGISFCQLSEQLWERGIALFDGHPWNMLFDRGKPLFVDWGSLRPRGAASSWPFEEFINYFVAPLLLISSRRGDLARLCYTDPRFHMRAGDAYRLMLGRVGLFSILRLRRRLASLQRESSTPSSGFFRRLCSLLRDIELATRKTEWSDYEGPGALHSHDNPSNWTEKIANVHGLLEASRPGSVLDIGSNRGWFSEAAASFGADVVSADIDEKNLDEIYHKANASRLSVLPAVFDVCSPTPTHALFGRYKTSTDRFRSDFVLMLAVIHHLCFKRGIRFPEIVSQLRSLTRKKLVVEFIPPDDQFVSKWYTDQYSWYSQDNFAKALSEHFTTIEVLPSSPKPRVLFVCSC